MTANLDHLSKLEAEADALKAEEPSVRPGNPRVHKVAGDEASTLARGTEHW